MANKQQNSSTHITSLHHDDKRTNFPTVEPLCLFVNKINEYKADKTATSCNRWVMAINNHRGFGDLAFLVLTDPWDAEIITRALF